MLSKYKWKEISVHNTDLRKNVIVDEENTEKYQQDNLTNLIMQSTVKIKYVCMYLFTYLLHSKRL